MAMILELAGHGPDLIQVTAQYSNAVLVALLPYFSDVAQKLDLPVHKPITIQDVVESRMVPLRYPNGDMFDFGVTVEGGWAFGFRRGYVSYVELWPSFFKVQEPEELPQFYGTVRMTKDEAIQMARDTIKKLGIPLEDVFAEQEPRVTLPDTVHATNTLPYYRIEWLNPRGGGSSTVDIGVNADAKRVERIDFGGGDDNLHRPPPKIDVLTSVTDTSRPHANPEYAWKLIPIVLRAVDEYGKTLGLPIPRPLTTNHVARFKVSDNGGWPHSVLELSNGWQFVYRNSMVNGYYAPDNLFWFPRKNQRMLIKDYAGKWKMSDAEAIALIRRTLAKLNYPTNLVHMDFEPRVMKPVVPGIPRCLFRWPHLNEAGDSTDALVEAEVDADKGELKSLYFENRALWNRRPPIDVPIALPARPATNAAPKPGLQPKAPPRPLTPLKLPKQRKPQ